MWPVRIRDWEDPDASSFFSLDPRAFIGYLQIFFPFYWYPIDSVRLKACIQFQKNREKKKCRVQLGSDLKQHVHVHPEQGFLGLHQRPLLEFFSRSKLGSVRVQSQSHWGLSIFTSNSVGRGTSMHRESNVRRIPGGYKGWMSECPFRLSVVRLTVRCGTRVPLTPHKYPSPGGYIPWVCFLDHHFTLLVAVPAPAAPYILLSSPGPAYQVVPEHSAERITISKDFHQKGPISDY